MSLFEAHLTHSGGEKKCWGQEKRAILSEAHKGKLQHLFRDVKDLSTGHAHCDIHGKTCPIPRVDVFLSGTACTSISGERLSNAEFARCYETGEGASGLTYQHGYRDTIAKSKATISMFENVLKVASCI